MFSKPAFISSDDVYNMYQDLTRQGYSIAINTATKTLTLLQNGKVIKTYPIAIGKPSTPTPKENF